MDALSHVLINTTSYMQSKLTKKALSYGQFIYYVSQLMYWAKVRKNSFSKTLCSNALKNVTPQILSPISFQTEATLETNSLT